MVEIHKLSWDCAVVVLAERQLKIINVHYKSQNWTDVEISEILQIFVWTSIVCC